MDVVSWVPLVGGVVAVGVLLLLIAAVGLLGAAHHHQVLLFFVSCGWGLGGGDKGWVRDPRAGDTMASGGQRGWGRPGDLGTPRDGDASGIWGWWGWGPQGWGHLGGRISGLKEHRGGNESRMPRLGT